MVFLNNIISKLNFSKDFLSFRHFSSKFSLNRLGLADKLLLVCRKAGSPLPPGLNEGFVPLAPVGLESPADPVTDKGESGPVSAVGDAASPSRDGIGPLTCDILGTCSLSLGELTFSSLTSWMLCGGPDIADTSDRTRPWVALKTGRVSELEELWREIGSREEGVAEGRLTVLASSGRGADVEEREEEAWFGGLCLRAKWVCFKIMSRGDRPVS